MDNENFVRRNIFENHFLIGIFAILCAFVAFQIKGIIISVFFAYILMAAFEPGVKILVKRRVPRLMSVILVYVLFLVLVTLLLVLLVPFLTSQVSLLINFFPFYLSKAASILGYSVEALNLSEVITSGFSLIGRNAISLTTKVFSGVFSLFAILVLGFYFLLDYGRLRDFLASLAGKKKERGIVLIDEINKKLGFWLKGQSILCLTIGVVTWAGLTILGVDFAVPLAVIAGVLEVVPTIGPIVSAVPAVVVALTISPHLAGIVILFYIVIQLLENNLLVPKIMGQSTGLSPSLVIIAILIGGSLLGVAGALLAVPTLTTVKTVIEFLRDDSKK
jgi:predicted PurR-regulated permease PerM